MRKDKERAIFEDRSVLSAVLRLALPTVLGQIILVVYNMADTFFIGCTGNDAMLSAVTICMPAFLFLSAISNLFGVGGAGVIARAYGAGQTERVRDASALAFWGCLAGTFFYVLLVFLLMDPFVRLLGGLHRDVHAFAASYLRITVVGGGLFTALSSLFSHLIRAEGRSGAAGFGIMLGGVLNIILDPLFMFRLMPPGQEIAGAALATALSNLISFAYFMGALLILRRRSRLSLKPCRGMLSSPLVRELLSAGLPACIMTLFENISYAFLDRLTANYGIAAQAGLGVAKKINMLAHCIVRGVAQGAMPLVAYSFAARRMDRLKAASRTIRYFAIGSAALCAAVFFIFCRPLCGLFIHTESPSLDYAAAFLRILCLGCPFSAAAYSIISFFQATGEGGKSFRLAVLRKGLLDIPLMFLLGALFPVFGPVAATPVTDFVCSFAAYMVFFRYMGRIGSPEKAFGLKKRRTA